MNLTSPLFYNLISKSDGVRYPVQEMSKDKLQDLLKMKLFQNSTLFERALSYKVPQQDTNVTTMKLLRTIPQMDGGMVYYIGFCRYDERVKARTRLLTKAFKILTERDDYKVQSLLQVGIGLLYGLLWVEENGEARFVRIRITDIDFTTWKVKYWAVDEAQTGEITRVDDLYFLNDYLAGLPMMAVPVVFDRNDKPTQEQINRFNDKKFFAGRLKEPYYAQDYAVRYLYFK